MLKRILAVIGGIVAGSLTVAAVEMLGHYLYPLPAGMKSDDMEAMKEYIPNAPFMALFFVIIAYALAALVVGFVSTKIANDGKNKYAIIGGVIFVIITIINLAMLPTPVWFWVLGIAVWGLVLAGYKLALNKNKE
ncbi:hypothetical protein PFY12_03660 [Chryseobacterium camelliae]|uniref:DUF4064 domain-containing protein n=1 Tax=Chryseobacterium camelliae TaxID=1265445 RepID=A0ABY7QQZ0_9FLAO|nr:hypothetical protein [Chryseobacterium camelliae]WBV61223.1 hypothetical protein PFY12_03660 [Chryseobacterium camelliae]